jgi:N6-adenosine-specific RNA methylase IME4
MLGGFDYVTGLSWGKWDRGQDRRTDDGRQVGVGYWFRGAFELVLVAKKPGAPSIRTKQPSLFLTPRIGHSRKPDFLHELVEEHFPGPYLELFGRQDRPGWRVVGDQMPGRPEKVEQFAATLISASSAVTHRKPKAA